jgi:hypothetical protein
MLNKHSIRFVSERDIGSEDVLFLLQALFHAENLYMICQPMYNYSCNTGSLSQVYNPGIIKRYVAFREYMLGYLRKCQASRKYFAMLECFFLGRLVIGTCITQEYYTVPQWHTMHDARAAVKRLLQMHEVQRSVKGANRSGMTRSKRAQLLALRLRIEPFFYWLYVTKPARKEG